MSRELQGSLPSGDKDKYHVWCFSSGEALPRISHLRWVGISAENKKVWTLTTRLPPGLGSRAAEILSLGSDASMAPLWPWQQSYLQIQETRRWNKKELSGTIRKQTQTEQDSRFPGKKTDCTSMSKSTKAVKGSWLRAAGIILYKKLGSSSWGWMWKPVRSLHGPQGPGS